MQASVVSTRLQDYGPMAALIGVAITGPVRKVAPEPGARIDLATANAELSKRLPEAVAQAERQLTAIAAAMDQGPPYRQVVQSRRAAERTLRYLRSDRGPAHQVEVLRAAGVREITARGGKPQTSLDRILAIGRAAARALEELPATQREQALARVLGGPKS
jgi:hypothetical protein